MPLTTAEKSKRYRERLKNNPEKYVISKQKSRARAAKQYRKKMKDMDERTKNEMRSKWREQYASRKLNTLPSGTEPQTNEPQSEVLDTDAEGQPRSEIEVAQEIDIEQPSATGRSERIKCNNIEMKQIQRNVTNNLRRENAKLHAKVIGLERRLNSLTREMRDFKKKYQELIKQFTNDTEEEKESHNVTVQDNTPLKRSDKFIEEHLANAEIETPKKEAIKRKIVEYNVLTDSLKQTYKLCQNPEKNILKGVVDNEFVKKYKIATNLTQNLGLQSNIRKYKENKNATKELKERLRIFYERDDVSRASAGKKECLTFKKCKKQKRYLSDKLRNLHKKYVTEFETISFSTFKKHRPFYVVAPNLKNLETCACLKHANMQFIINSLKSVDVLKNNDFNLIMPSLVCEQTFKQCMYDECSACANNVIKIDDIEIDKTVKWFAWTFKDHVYNEKGNTKTAKRMVKLEKTGSIQELFDLFHAELKAFKRHVFNVRHQYQQYKLCIDNLESNEAAIHIDFSENWVCKYNHEVQAMHFGASKKQITLHTGVLYVKNEKPFSFCSISENNAHSPEAIWAHLHPILEYIRSAHPNINTLHFHSDGPTSQYRQKKNFYLLCKNMHDLGFNSTWSFFEAAHGKGAADGIGGSVKRALDFKVSHGLDIPSAETAFQVLQDSESSVRMFLIPPDNIQPLDTSVVKNLTPIRNTMKIHQLITQSKFSLKHRILSCFCQSLQGKCECHNPELHTFNINEDLGNEKDVLLDEATGEIIMTVYSNENSNSNNDSENVDYTNILPDEEMMVENSSMKRKITNLQKHVKQKRMKTHVLSKKGCNLINSSEDEDVSDNYSVHDTSDSLNSLDATDLAVVNDESEEVIDERKEVDENEEVNDERRQVNEESEELNDERTQVYDENKEVNDESKQVNDESKQVNDENDFEYELTNIEMPINEGSYVLVKFLTGKTTKHYIGEVIEVYDNISYRVKFLRNKGKGRFAWPITEDISVVYSTDIGQILQKPISERRGIKTFDIDNLSLKIE